MSVISILTATTPATSRDLSTVDAWQAQSGITVSGADATAVAQLITSASRAIEQFCNRSFAREVLRETIWPERDPYPYQVPGGVGVLQLQRWPLAVDADGNAMASVVEGVGTAAKPLTLDEDFMVDTEIGHLVRLNQSGLPMTWPAQKFVVAYTAGWVVPGQADSSTPATLPPDITDACNRLVIGRWYERRRDPYLKSVQVEGVDRVDYWIPNGDTGNFPPDVTDLLDNYRVPVLA
jgi:hypothetical protein